MKVAVRQKQASRLVLLMPVLALTTIYYGYARRHLSAELQVPAAASVSPGVPSEAAQDLQKIYRAFTGFRMQNQGNFPASATDLMSFMISNGVEVELGDLSGASGGLSIFTNPDAKYADDPNLRSSAEGTIIYRVVNRRPDGSPLAGAKPLHTEDVLATTNIYEHSKGRVLNGEPFNIAKGFHVVLWTDGRIENIPLDCLLHSPVPSQPQRLTIAYPGQAGVTWNVLLSEERRPPSLIIGKPTLKGRDIPTPDNGGPESLVTFSRLLSFPSRYGIEREELWKHFDSAQEEFTLTDLQAGAAKLNFSLDLKTLSLDELQLNAPAIFLTSDDKRLVVLSQLDDKDAIVIDRGLTRIVSRDLLARRYGGQVLVASSTSTAVNAPQVLADDPVRSLALTSPDQAVTQTVKITNSGTAPLSLQVERPIPGAEKAELSASTLAPGQSATLSLTLRWRTILKSPTQNVLVFLATNDPRRPRLPLAFKLSLPQANPQDAAPANPATP